MAISKRGIYDNPIKSPFNFEKYDSDLERKMMEKLEHDPIVIKWMKRHGISIPWVDGQKHQRRYSPDFLVEFSDGRIVLIEVKDPSRIDSDDVKRKRKAAELWCQKRGIEYVLMTIKE
ncbi:MAG: TnsA endonuclease N-terminal domain-containing protein [Fimbriimonadia bacterium]|nr:TnsA endonuclease N-terminal domain-containing protein [Fimbriimonadia bacterium]